MPISGYNNTGSASPEYNMQSMFCHEEPNTASSPLLLKNKIIPAKKVPPKHSCRREDFCNHLVQAQNINPDAQDAQIRNNSHGADEIKKKDTFVAGPAPGAKDETHRQVIIYAGRQNERDRAADQVVQPCPVKHACKYCPFQQRANAPHEEIFRRAACDVRSQQAAGLFFRPSVCVRLVQW